LFNPALLEAKLTLGKFLISPSGLQAQKKLSCRKYPLYKIRTEIIALVDFKET
jgi:hypothetical protein